MLLLLLCLATSTCKLLCHNQDIFCEYQPVSTTTGAKMLQHHVSTVSQDKQTEFKMQLDL